MTESKFACSPAETLLTLSGWKNAGETVMLEFKASPPSDAFEFAHACSISELDEATDEAWFSTIERPDFARFRLGDFNLFFDDLDRAERRTLWIVPRADAPFFVVTVVGRI